MKRRYSKIELEYIKQKLPLLTYRDLAAQLGRTPMAIALLASRLKLNRKEQA